ncbi:PoNe immunity protein domain-containing protein [Pseudorhodoferax sp.]|uniref:PoNe immunity protein domain-containing protein n=1 Tax=Pseudorhodoferax sp. TaxID=1993553 RepID=UPI0039E47FE6
MVKNYAVPTEESLFLSRRRDIGLGYPAYRRKATGIAENFDFMTSAFLAQRAAAPDCTPSDLATSAHAKALDAITYLHLQYSAGQPIADLSRFFVDALSFWEEYARYHEAFHQSPTAPYVVAHLTLRDDGYWDAIRLVSFGALLGFTHDLSRVCAVMDYGNQPRDGLLDRLVAPFVAGRAPLPDTCTRHLPYSKLLKVFDASPDKRPALMAKYMDEWYTASRREPYYGSQQKGREHGYLGLWSFEAAAVTYVLQIDDSSYRDKDFYPRDLVDHARSLPLPPELGGVPALPLALSEAAFPSTDQVEAARSPAN